MIFRPLNRKFSPLTPANNTVSNKRASCNIFVSDLVMMHITFEVQDSWQSLQHKTYIYIYGKSNKLYRNKKNVKTFKSRIFLSSVCNIFCALTQLRCMQIAINSNNLKIPKIVCRKKSPLPPKKTTTQNQSQKQQQKIIEMM